MSRFQRLPDPTQVKDSATKQYLNSLLKTLKYNFDRAGGSTTGSSLASTDDLSEGSTNKYFTNERVDDRVASLLVAGSNITLTYNDVSNTLTVASSGGGGGGNSYFPSGW